MAPKLRIAWVSDYDTSTSAPTSAQHETLSSYCSSLLVPRLRERFDIEVFCECSPQSANTHGASILGTDTSGVRHYLTALMRHKEQPFDLFFYQLEDHARARFVRSHIGLMPGILWAHDLYLSDLGAEALHTSPWEQTIQRYYDCSEPFADKAKPPHQLMPLAYREVSLSPIVLCSSARGVAGVERITGMRLTTDGGEGDFQVGYLPVPVESGAGDASSCNPKGRLGKSRAATSELRVVTAASVGLEGRAHKFLAALKGYAGEWKLTWLINRFERERASALIEEFGVVDRVVLVEGRNPTVWHTLVQSADVALHLHNGFYGHTGPYLHISLAAGVACIAVRAMGGVDFPESVVWTVVPGHHEALQIREVLGEISRIGPDVAGAPGQSYAQHECGVESVANILSREFERGAEQLKGIMSSWDELYRDAKSALFDEVRNLMDGSEAGGISPYEQVFKPAARELGWE